MPNKVVDLCPFIGGISRYPRDRDCTPLRALFLQSGRHIYIYIGIADEKVSGNLSKRHRSYRKRVQKMGVQELARIGKRETLADPVRMHSPFS